MKNKRSGLIVAGAIGVAVIVAVVIVAVLASGSSGLSDSASCTHFAEASTSERHDYVRSKLSSEGTGDPSAHELDGYVEGMELNCSKGYANSTNLREFEGTQSEVKEIEGEGGTFDEGIATIRERTEEREDFSALCEEEVIEC